MQKKILESYTKMIGMKIHNVFTFFKFIKNVNESKCGILIGNPYDALIAEFTRHKSKTYMHIGAPKWTEQKFKTEL